MRSTCAVSELHRCYCVLLRYLANWTTHNYAGTLRVVTAEADPESVGAFFRAARLRKGLSKRQAAKLAGISEITWRNLESGLRQIAPGQTVPYDPREETLAAAATALDVPLDVAFDVAGRPAPDRRSTIRITPVGRADGSPNVEVAIAADSDLDEDQQSALLAVYRTMKIERALRPSPEPEPEGP